MLISPKNAQELFNLWHAQARNVIERIFGVLKRHFRILLLSPEYNMEIQACIPAALAAIHNFIRINDSEDVKLTLPVSVEAENHRFGGVAAGDDELGRDLPRAARGGEPDDNAPLPAEGSTATERRDQIAQAMWVQYQEVLRARVEAEEGSEEEDSSEGIESDKFDNE